jgi:hypothetical protein
MDIPNELSLTIEDLRHLRNAQLSLLTGIRPNYFSAWSRHRKISERALEQISKCLGMSKPDVLYGLELRRTDIATAMTVQEKGDRLIEFLQRANKEIA